MADIGAATRSRLIADVTVGGLLAARVYPDQLPQHPTLPAAVYYVVSGNEETYLGGLVGVVHARLQIDAYAPTRLQANALSVAIRNALAAGGGRGTWGTVAVTGCTPQGTERYDTQPLGDGSETPQYITSRDFLISFNE
jgi:hypothetical protein